MSTSEPSMCINRQHRKVRTEMTEERKGQGIIFKEMKFGFSNGHGCIGL